MAWLELGLEYSGLGSRTRPGLCPAKAEENISAEHMAKHNPKSVNNCSHLLINNHYIVTH